MAENNLKGLRVTILASDGFEEMELVAPREALDEAGAETELLAPGTGTIYGMKHHDKAEKVNIDVRIEDATPADLPTRASRAWCAGSRVTTVNRRRRSSWFPAPNPARTAPCPWRGVVPIRFSRPTLRPHIPGTCV